MKIELLPCLHCGSENIVINCEYSHAVVECVSCSSRGPWMNGHYKSDERGVTFKAAIMGWNQRVEDYLEREGQ